MLKKKEGRTKDHTTQKIFSDKVIYAPEVENNFYTSCLDSSPNDLLGVGLSDGCYLYNHKACFEVESVCRSRNSLSCVKFNKTGAFLFTGYSNGYVGIHDVGKLKNFRLFKNQSSRIGCIQDIENQTFLCGSKDHSIVLNDLRMKYPKVLIVLAHSSEVCNISQSSSTIASSDASGVINIWDIRNEKCFSTHRLFKQSAIKALEWCPWKNGILAAGGGSQDSRIILWNNHEREVSQKIKTGSQVTRLIWSKYSQ